MEIFLKGILNHQAPLKIHANSLEQIHNEISSQLNLSSNEFYLASQRGVKLSETSVIQHGDTLCLCARVLGGKGGFGSLLRAFGKQITLSTDKGACRDLTGRRIRHVDNEKKLKDFVNNQKEIEKQKELKKEEKSARLKRKRDKFENTHHLFLDPSYDKQKKRIAEDLDEAIGKSGDGQRKRKLISSTDEQEAPLSPPDHQATDVVLPQTSASANLDSIAKFDLAKSKNIEENAKDKSVLEKKKEKNINSLKDWMGVDDLDVSSCSDDDEDDQPPKKSIKSM
jgi:hypothetical protein